MTPELASSHAFCNRVARREAKNFYPSFLLLPADRRRSMCALYAFMRHSDDLADEPGAPEAKRAALETWRSALNAVASGGAADPSGWPGWPAFAETIRRHAIPTRYLNAVLDGVAMDVEPHPLPDEAALRSYCYHVATAVGLCCLHIWGFRSEGGRAEQLADAAGQALQRTNIVRDVGEDAREGRVYLPADRLSAFGVTLDDLRASRVSEPLRRLLADEARRAYHEYENAKALVPLVAPEARPVLEAMVGIYRGLLTEIERRQFEVLETRVSVPGWKKALIVFGALASRWRPAGRAGLEASRIP
ncbi:MAG: phytoene/squalene synthase family protein [Isosphaeraceae bacterium]